MPPKKAPAKKLHELAPEVRVGHKIADVSKKTFIVGKQFATGGFGRIHTCTEEGKSHQMVMKIEPSTNGPLLTEVVVFNRILKQEHLEAYKKKKKIQWIGLPYIIANGYFTYNNDKMRYMIIPKYAMSLEGAREANGGTLTVKDSLTVANCVLGALEYLHDVDYTHADIKAANILLEKERAYSSAVLVDFGLAHRTTNNVDKPDKKRAHNGTCIFTSTDAHRGNNPSFRGDVEILAYNLVMWLTGTLPWMALESSPDKVFEAKQKFVVGLPTTLQNVLKATTPPAVIQCITTMFKMSMETSYTSKVNTEKLKKLVTEAIQKSSASTSVAEKKVSKTPARSTRARAPISPGLHSNTSDIDEIEENPKKKVATSTRGRKTRYIESDDEEKEEVKKKTPKKSSSRLQEKSRKVYVDEEEIEDKEEEEVIVSRLTKSRSSRRKVEEDKEEEEFESVTPEIDDDVIIPSSSRRPRMRLGLTSSTASSDRIAKRIEQKYKRLSTNKSSMVPISITVSPGSGESSSSPSTSSRSKRLSGGMETVTLKTPVLLSSAVKKAKYTSGISSATKASPTELRRVPGVRNFPKGRRSMIIKETAASYKKRRAAATARPPTFDDASSSSDV